MIAMSSGAVVTIAVLSAVLFTRSGSVDVGLAGRHRSRGGRPRRRRVVLGSRSRTRPHRLHPHPDADVVVRHVEQRLVAEHHIGVVEPHVHPGERLGLGLARVLHRRDDRVVGDHAGLRQLDLVLGGRARSRRSGRSRGRRCRCGRRSGTAGRGSGPLRRPASARSTFGVTGIRVRDRRVVLHHRHRLLGGARRRRSDHRLLAGDERLDVGDVADALGPPPRRDPHAGRHRVDRAGVDRVQERRVGAVELDRARRRTAGRAGAATVGVGHPRPRSRRCRPGRRRRSRGRAPAPVSGSHSRGGTMTRSPLRIPMIRCSVSAVMNAPTTGPSDRLYGNWIVLWTACTTRVPPETTD